MAQFGRPISDVSIGVWTDDVGGTTNLWTVLDDNTTTEYIEDLNGGNGTYECNITSLTDPVSNINHIIRFSMQGTGSGGPERCEVQLWQGTSSQIASTGAQTSRGAWATQTYTLTATEADAITDYTDLNIRVISSNLGGTEDMWNAWVELEIPDAVSGDISGTVSANSVVSAILVGKGALKGIIDANSIVTTSLIGGGLVKGVVNTSSTVTANILAKGQVKGLISANSLVSANITAIGVVKGIINTSSTVTCNLVPQPSLISGTVTTSSTVTANLTAKGRVFGAINALSNVTANLLAKGFLKGVINTLSTVTTNLIGKAFISGTVSGSSTVSALIQGKGIIKGTVSANSVVTCRLVNAGAVFSPISGTINCGSTVTCSMISAGDDLEVLNFNSYLTTEISKSDIYTIEVNEQSKIEK